ncbi:MAG: nuclear transport factor 2 family protein [Thermoleophilaceae bacterium]
MSDELVQNVYRAYDAFARRDFDALAALCEPDCTFKSLVMESEGTEYRGYDGLREYFDSLTDVLPDWRPEVEMVEDHDDRVLVRARIYATPSGGSVPIEQVMWQVIEFRNLRALRWDFFRTEEEARAALEA